MSRKNRNASRPAKFHGAASRLAFLKQRRIDRVADLMLRPLPVKEPERSREATRRADTAAQLINETGGDS